MRFVFTSLFCLVVFGQISAQSTAYVFHGGLSMGFQRWANYFDRQPLFKTHAALSVESVNNDDDHTSIFAQIGYHVRGSATRLRFLQAVGGGVETISEEFRFNNLSLILGYKQKFPLGEKTKYFYYGGLRGDYTLSTNIDELGVSQNIYLAAYYPSIGAMNRWMVGASAGGGIEFPFSDLVGGQLTISVHPDFLLQYYRPAFGNLIDPFNPGQTIPVQELSIRNLSLEISFGIRLLRKVVYE
ncbi:MAG: hypothetical protein ABMA02_06355 [Saprospiraceae bacterium]